MIFIVIDFPATPTAVSDIASASPPSARRASRRSERAAATPIDAERTPQEPPACERWLAVRGLFYSSIPRAEEGEWAEQTMRGRRGNGENRLRRKEEEEEEAEEWLKKEREVGERWRLIEGE